MALSVDCGKVRPEEACNHVIRAESEEELMQKVAEHAKTHNLEPTPELVAKVKQHIERTYAQPMPCDNGATRTAPLSLSSA